MPPIRFQCPLCREYFQAQPAAASRTVRCPSCRGEVRLPPLAQPAQAPCGVIPPPVATTSKLDPAERDPYQVRDYDDEPPARAGAAPQRYLAVVCRVCGSRLHFAPSDAGRTVDCPDCGTKLTIAPPSAKT